MEDPFLLDQNRIEGQLEQLRPQFQRWRQLRDCERPPMGTEEREVLEEEYHYLTNELSKSVRSIRWDADDLQETLGLMLKAKSAGVSATSDRDSRAAFLARVSSFLDEVAREVAMATTATGSPTEPGEPDDEGIEDGEDDIVIDLEAGKRLRPSLPPKTAAAMPLLAWRKDTDSSSLSFPTVELDSLQDLRGTRFHSRDWTGCVYRYRYLLAMLGVTCLIVLVTIVALAAKHTAASARAPDVAAARATTAAPNSKSTCAPGWKHLWCLIE